MSNNNYISYATLLKSIKDFKKSGSKNSDFNIYDTPSHKFFKIFFYFGDEEDVLNNNGYSTSGLLHPTWKIYNENGGNDLGFDYRVFNSAWSYLKLNDENERAEKLERFVTLLSNINCNSPWYFTSLSGIDAALERKVANDGNLDVTEPRTLSITCLPDAFDNRIGTLLELYRDITWSWHNKKEILPANLRKFDMAVYIFESPVENWSNYKPEDSSYISSYKLLEFRDCEFNYNSVKSGWGDINNQTGFTPTFTIDINYNDCYEESYNEIMMRKIGDVILTDTYAAVLENNDGENISQSKFKSDPQVFDKNQNDGVQNRTNNVSKNTKYSQKSTEEIYSFGNLGDINHFEDPITKYSQKSTEEIYSFGNLGDINHFEKAVDENPSKIVKESEIEKPGFLGNIAKELYYTGRQHVDNLLYEKTGYSTNIKRAIMGNLYTYSLSNMGMQLDQALKGHITTTGLTVKQYIDNAQERAAAKVKKSGNLGNLYKNTLANN